MTQEEQRVAIAEACGWKYVEGLNVSSLSHSGATSCADCWVCPKRGAGYGAYEPPNYLNDLNAMHEAEKMLAQRTTDVLGSYQLYCQVLLDFFGSGVSYTASQRAKAFLRTIGKWKECK